MKTLFLFLILISSHLALAMPTTEPLCDELLNQPAIIQELYRLKHEELTAKDRAQALILKNAFEEKLVETAKVLNISSDELLQKITARKIVIPQTPNIQKRDPEYILLAPYEKIIEDFKRNYSNYNNLEIESERIFETILSEKYSSFRELGPRAIRTLVIAIAKTALNEKNPFSWPFQNLPFNDLLLSALYLTSDFTLINAIVELSKTDDTMTIDLSKPLNPFSMNVFSDDGAPSIDLIKLLVEELRIDLSKNNSLVESTLHRLAMILPRTKRDFVDIFEYIFKNTQSLFTEKKNLYGYTPLFWFSAKELQWAISKGLNINIVGLDHSLFSYKLEHFEDFESAKILIEANADLTLHGIRNKEIGFDKLIKVLNKYKHLPKPQVLLDIKNLVEKKYGVTLP